MIVGLTIVILWFAIVCSVVTIIVSKSTLQFFLNCGRSKLRYFSVETISSTILMLFYEQRLNCVYSVHAICTAHNHFIIVTLTLHLSAKKTNYLVL